MLLLGDQGSAAAARTYSCRKEPNTLEHCFQGLSFCERKPKLSNMLGQSQALLVKGICYLIHSYKKNTVYNPKPRAELLNCNGYYAALLIQKEPTLAINSQGPLFCQEVTYYHHTSSWAAPPPAFHPC